MDGSRFDGFSRSLVAGHSRRTLTRVLGGLAMAGSLSLLGRSDAAARRKKHGKKCKGRQRRCGKACIPARDCCLGGKRVADHTTYNQCGLCAGGVMLTTLACATIDPDGCTECDDAFACVPAADGTPCAQCRTCQGGLCEGTCPAEQGCCGDRCCETCPELRFCYGHGCCEEEKICCGLSFSLPFCCAPERCIGDKCCLAGYCGPGVCKRTDEQCCLSAGTACPSVGACCGDGRCCPGSNQTCVHCNETGWRCCDLNGNLCDGACTEPVPGRTA